MATALNGLFICAYLLIFLTKQSTLACDCAKQDNYSTPVPLTSTEHGTDGQSTTCSYDLNGVHYYCVYDSNGKLVQDNDLGYCPQLISNCAQPDSICPAKDAHGTTLTDTIPNNDGSVTCTFGTGACLYDSNEKLLEDKNGGACRLTVIEVTTNVTRTQSSASPTVATTTVTTTTMSSSVASTTTSNPTTTAASQTLSTMTSSSISTTTASQTLSTTTTTRTTTSNSITSTTTRTTTSNSITSTTTRTTTSNSITSTTTRTTTSNSIATTTTTRTTTSNSIASTTRTTTSNSIASTTRTTTSNSITSTTTRTTTSNSITSTTTRTMTSSLLTSTTSVNTVTTTSSQTLSTTMTSRITTTSSISTTTTQNPTTTTTIGQTLSTTTTTKSTTSSSISTRTTQNPTTTTTTSQNLSTTTTTSTTTNSSLTSMTTQNATTITTTNQTLSTTTVTTTQSIITDYYIQFYFSLDVDDENMTDTLLVSQLMSIFTTALGITSNQINIIITTETSNATKHIVVQVRYFSTVTETADDLFAQTQKQFSDPSSKIRQQNLTSQLTESSIQNVERFYTCSNDVLQESPCETSETSKSGTPLSVILVASIVPSFVVLTLLFVGLVVYMRYIRRPTFKQRISRFDRF